MTKEEKTALINEILDTIKNNPEIKWELLAKLMDTVSVSDFNVPGPYYYHNDDVYNKALISMKMYNLLESQYVLIDKDTKKSKNRR